MLTRLLILGVTGFLSCTVFASSDVSDVGITADNADMIMADNRRKGRRDDRQENRDDKQDCRQEEGRVGDDKRECKRENNGEGDGDKEKEEAAEA